MYITSPPRAPLLCNVSSEPATEAMAPCPHPVNTCFVLSKAALDPCATHLDCDNCFAVDVEQLEEDDCACWEEEAQNESVTSAAAAAPSRR